MKSLKTYQAKIEKGKFYKNITIPGTTPQHARDWYQRVSRTGRYKGRKDIPGIKRYHGWRLTSVKPRKTYTRRRSYGWGIPTIRLPRF